MIRPISLGGNTSFNGKLESGYLPKMLEKFSSPELAEYKNLINKAEKIQDGRFFTILQGRRCKGSSIKEFSVFYQFVEMKPETKNTFLPLSLCIKEVLAEKVFFMREGYNDKSFPKACIEVILEPLRKLYSDK